MKIITDKINKYGIHKNVELILRRVDFTNSDFLNNKSDLVDLYNRSTYYIHTSNREAFSYAIAEAIDYNLYTLALPWKWGYSTDIWGDIIMETEDEIIDNVLKFNEMNFPEKLRILKTNKLKLKRKSLLPLIINFCIKVTKLWEVLHLFVSYICLFYSHK